MKILGIRFRKVDRLLLKSFSNVLSMIVGIVAFCFLFLAPTTCAQRLWSFAIVLFVIFAAFVFHWIKISNRNEVVIKVGRMNVSVGVGDLWSSKGLKVVAFNEFMDTVVDDKIIASKSLNGQYIERFEIDISQLDNAIVNDLRLLGNISEKQVRRPHGGKTTRYRLGSIFERGEFLLLAFSKFDDENRAYLTLSSYVECLASFWKELNKIYSLRDVSIPLLGSGITRFVDSAGQDMSPQSLLRVMLWTLWQSNCKFSTPCNLKVVLTKSMLEKIDLLALEYSLMED